MKKIAIVGTGPTGIYTFFFLLQSAAPLSISLYEQAEQAGVGMPYSDGSNSRMMLANIASIEIPPLATTYLEWLRTQEEARLAEFGVDKAALHERQFLPRLLLGEFFRAQFLALCEYAQARGFSVAVHESCEVTDIEAGPRGVTIWVRDRPVRQRYDFAVVATGHVWPEEDKAKRNYFPSPWSGLLAATIPACKVGVMGTSLSAIDAAMAVVEQHGEFIERGEGQLMFERAPAGEGLAITLMSRSGILPEADFYCPIPYEPLQIATQQAIEAEILAGTQGLLDRVFALIAREIALVDPAWSKRVGLPALDADSFAHAYFSDRERYDPFRWAHDNLAEVERNRIARRTVPWRYAILRLHEAVQPVVPHLETHDRARFDVGLCKVFVDNYAAIPPESIRRLLALREAGLINVLALGCGYDLEIEKNRAVVSVAGKRFVFDVFIDARGQRPLKISDLPFPRLRRQLRAAGEVFPDVGDDYTLREPEAVRGCIAFGALPYLMHDRPFVQGITACASIGAAIAKAAMRDGAYDGIRRALLVDAH